MFLPNMQQDGEFKMANTNKDGIQWFSYHLSAKNVHILVQPTSFALDLPSDPWNSRMLALSKMKLAKVNKSTKALASDAKSSISWKPIEKINLRSSSYHFRNWSTKLALLFENNESSSCTMHSFRYFIGFKIFKCSNCALLAAIKSHSANCQISGMQLSTEAWHNSFILLWQHF